METAPLGRRFRLKDEIGRHASTALFSQADVGLSRAGAARKRVASKDGEGYARAPERTP
jgi:hypothetical protein